MFLKLLESAVLDILQEKYFVIFSVGFVFLPLKFSWIGEHSVLLLTLGNDKNKEPVCMMCMLYIKGEHMGLDILNTPLQTQC